MIEELRKARVSRVIGTYGGHITIAPAAMTFPSQREPALSLATSVNMMSPIKSYRTSVPKGPEHWDTLWYPEIAPTEPLSG